MTNRYNSEQRIVTPVTAQGRNYPISPAQAQQLMQTGTDGPAMAHSTPQAQSVIDNVFTPQAIGKDPYTPAQRAVGLALRTVPFAVVYIILALGIADRLVLADTWIYILFGVPMLLTVAIMSDRTNKYTPAGVEISRIAAAERVEFTKGERQERILDKHLTQQQELRRMALEATLRMLERGDSHDDK